MQVCILLSAGAGLRCGQNQPKQYCLVNDQPLVYYTLQKLRQSAFDLFIVVCTTDYFDFWQDLLLTQNLNFTLVSGGLLRSDSVLAALEKCPKNTRLVAIHDGARPNPDLSYIQKALFLAADKQCGVIPGLKISDSIKMVRQNMVLESVSRTDLYTVQTPQIFPWPEILSAYQAGVQSGFIGSDDADYFVHSGRQVLVLDGDCNNIKITWPADFIKFKAFLDGRSI